MSANPTPVTPELMRYVASHTRTDDAFLVALKEDAARRGLPPIWISPAQGSVMQILLKLTKASDILEVGTLGGYSAITMARALPANGRVVTIEAEPAHARFAREWIAKSDVAAKIQVLDGRGVEVIPALADATFDGMFVDADKSGQPTYARHAERLLRQGGLFMVDNAFAFGQLLDDEPSDPDVKAVSDFNDAFAVNPAFHGSMIAVGDGLWVAVRL